MDKELLLFSENHLWISLDTKNAYIGLTHYIRRETGELYSVDLPRIDSKITKGDIIFSIDSKNLEEDFISPLTGVVVDVNQEINTLGSDFETISEQDSWFVKIKLNDLNEIEELIDYEEYVEVFEK